MRVYVFGKFLIIKNNKGEKLKLSLMEATDLFAEESLKDIAMELTKLAVKQNMMTEEKAMDVVTTYARRVLRSYINTFCNPN